MGRTPQPLEVAKLKGAIKHDPQRYRNVPTGSAFEIGKPPARMGAQAKLMWFEIIGEAPPGLLTASERKLLEVLSNLFVDYLADPASFSAAKLAAMDNRFGQLGMSPTARRKIAVDKKPEENEFNVF